MDKTTLENQSILWNVRECREDSNLDSDFGICSDCL